MATPPRAVLYAAKSHDDRKDKDAGEDEQREFDSIAYQLDSCRHAAGERGYIIHGEYWERDVSGPVMRGEQLQLALADLEAGHAQVLLVTRIDRVVRNYELQEDLRRRLLIWGARWDCVEHDPPPMEYLRSGEKLLAGVRALVNEQQSIDAGLAQRAKAEARNRNGFWVGGPPFGYRCDPRIGLVADGGIYEHPKETAVDPGQLLGIELGSPVAQYLVMVHLLLTTGNIPRVLDILARSPWLHTRTRTSLETVCRNRAHLGQVRLPIRTYTQAQAEQLVAEDPANRWVERFPRKARDRPPYRRWACVVWSEGRHQPLIDEITYGRMQRVLRDHRGESGRGRRRNTEVYPLSGRVFSGCAQVIMRDAEGAVVGRRPLGYTGHATQHRRKDGSVHDTRYYVRADHNTRGYRAEVVHTGDAPVRVNAEKLEGWVVDQLEQIAGSDERWGAVQALLATEAELGLDSAAVISMAAGDRRRECMEERARLKAELLAGVERPAQRVYGERIDELDDLITEQDRCIAGMEQLEVWYRGLPALLDVARRQYLRAVEYGRVGMSQLLRAVLRDIMPEHGGVIIHGHEDWQLTLRLGRDIEKQANTLHVIEREWAVQANTYTVLDKVLRILAA